MNKWRSPRELQRDLQTELRRRMGNSAPTVVNATLRVVDPAPVAVVVGEFISYSAELELRGRRWTVAGHSPSTTAAFADLVGRAEATSVPFLPGPPVRLGREAVTVGFAPPGNFPLAAYNAIYLRVDGQPESIARQHFRAAWTGTILRHRAAHESGHAFADAIREHGSAPAPDLRYQQDDALFRFFVALIATLESVAYGLHAAAAMVDPMKFPLATPRDQLRVTFDLATRRFQEVVSAARLAAAMESVRKDRLFTQARKVRNVLAHRAGPGRHHHYGLAPLPATTWRMEIHGEDDLALSPATTTERVEWLDDTLRLVMADAFDFVDTRLPELGAAADLELIRQLGRDS